MIRAVVFDFDGVILESSDLKTEAFRQLFIEEKPELLRQIVAYHKQNMGISRFVKFRHIHEHILRKPYTDETERGLGSRFADLIDDGIKNSAFVKGAREFLVEHHRQYDCFVASGTPEQELLTIAANKEIARYFRELHGSPKQKADILKDILRRYSLRKEELVFVGDAPSDLRAARETGVIFVGRIQGDNLAPADCDRAIEDLTGLGNLLGQIGRRK